MRLIDEIEAAAMQYHDKPKHTTLTERRAAMLVGGPYWPRIKAALEAGEEMTQELAYLHAHGRLLVPGEVLAIMIRFRAAMEGK